MKTIATLIALTFATPIIAVCRAGKNLSVKCE